MCFSESPFLSFYVSEKVEKKNKSHFCFFLNFLSTILLKIQKGR
ncbi:MAG: hypothetical protein AVDCRST_MAG96-2654 [uncultured Segetibacter sp.]|uniref:Uncharacterized protein n=1 Tax=uncultured Segetibacter sp. TaxID=481133 RepID=A0A6J4T7I5_9BACT|nr:MAG: hypothetical protein AVDCRST_MAG96-2654 [uncultured Segetibacter sp.]